MEQEKILDIIKDYKNKSNKDLITAMNHLSEDFEFTKNSILKFSEHLDKLENTYNLLLKEFNNRK
jgi:hypothetical protein